MFMGGRLQRLRRENGHTQAQLAEILDISTSYLNQIENNKRPLTMPVLMRLNAELGIDLQAFSDEESAGLAMDVRDALAENGVEGVAPAELQSLVSNMPEIAKGILEMHRVKRLAQDRADALVARFGGDDPRGSFALPAEHDEVRDYLNVRQNHIAELDAAAEFIFSREGMSTGLVAEPLAECLAKKHGVSVQVVAMDTLGAQSRRWDADHRVLSLPDYLTAGQQAFQMGVQLAQLEHGGLLDQLIDEGGFSGEEARRLARIGLSNYFAGALVMPYTEFLQSAEELHYDIDRLAHRFAVGFESVCHRLSTLQRPGASGLPFFFIRVDRAGNVSKRQSATDFHFSRIGGSCPLWVVYEAFSQPAKLLTQIAVMPDGRQYLWVARQVVSGPLGHGRMQKTFAIGLGCDLRHAHRMVYSRGLDLRDPTAATPIGVGCKVCERRHCVQRALPSLLDGGNTRNP